MQERVAATCPMCKARVWATKTGENTAKIQHHTLKRTENAVMIGAEAMRCVGTGCSVMVFKEK